MHPSVVPVATGDGVALVDQAAGHGRCFFWARTIVPMPFLHDLRVPVATGDGVARTQFSRGTDALLLGTDGTDEAFFALPAGTGRNGGRGRAPQ